MLYDRSWLLLPALLLFLLPPQTAEARSVTVLAGEAEVDAGSEVSVPVSVRDCEGLSGLSFNLRYQPDLLEFVDVVEGPLLREGLLEHQLQEPGLLKIDLLPDQTITGNGELLAVTFRAVGEAGKTAELTLEQLLAADDLTREMLVAAEHGKITVVPGGPGLMDVLAGLLVLGGVGFLVWQLRRRRTGSTHAVASEPAADSTQAATEPADSVPAE